MADAAAELVAPDARQQAPHHNWARPVSLIALVALWWIASGFAASPQFLPTPTLVLGFAWEHCRNGELPLNIAITLGRVLAAFATAMLAGGALGYAAGRSHRLDALVDPWVVVALNLPILVVVVLCYIWIGLNELAAVLAVAIAKAPTVFVTMREGARALDPQLQDVAQVFRLPPWRRFRRFDLPQLMPYVAAAARSGLSITWKIVLVVELLGRPNGVGFALNLYFQNFDVTGILAYGLAFAAIMLVVETALLRPWERRASAWRRHA